MTFAVIFLPFWMLWSPLVAFGWAGKSLSWSNILKNVYTNCFFLYPQDIYYEQNKFEISSFSIRVSISVCLPNISLAYAYPANLNSWHEYFWCRYSHRQSHFNLALLPFYSGPSPALLFPGCVNHRKDRLLEVNDSPNWKHHYFVILWTIQSNVEIFMDRLILSPSNQKRDLDFHGMISSQGLIGLSHILSSIYMNRIKRFDCL